MTIICQNCKELTACKCPNFIKYAPENTFGPVSTIEETIPSPLSDYYLNIIQKWTPIYGVKFDTEYDPVRELKRQRIAFVWREHIDNTFKCPNGHMAQIGTDWDGSITIYCEGDCNYNIFAVEL